MGAGIWVLCHGFGSGMWREGGSQLLSSGREAEAGGWTAAARETRDVPVECQLQGAWFSRGCAAVGSVLSPTWLGSQDRASGPRIHSKSWSSGSQVKNAHRHLLPLWLKPLPESKGRRKEKSTD